MKFTANRLLMYQAVKTVLKAVRKSKDIPEIGGILIEADAGSGILTLTGTDIRTHIQRRLSQEHIEESGSMIVMPVLSDMLRLLAGEFVEFEANNGLVTLRSDTCCYTISYLEAKGFPKPQIPFPEDTIQIKGINSLIRRTIFATDETADNYSTTTFSYVKLSFKGGITTAEATDGKCVAVSASPHCADGNLEMILHEKALTILDGIVNPDEELYVGIVGNYAVFMKEDLFFSTLLFTGKYLEASKILDSFRKDYEVTADAKELYKMIIDLSVVFDTKDDKCINLRVEPDRICAQVTTAKCSSISHVQALGTIPTPPDGFYYLPRLWTDCLRHMAGPVQIEIDQRGFVVMKANGSRYFIAPRGPARILQEKEPEQKSRTKSQKSKVKTTAAKAA